MGLTVVPESNANTYKSPFLRDFIHLNVAMMTSNNALVPDPDKQDDLASQAWQWPILNVGLRMCGWDDKSTLQEESELNLAIKYYLLGNPINVWSSTASIVVFGIVAVIYLLRWQRHYIDFTPAYLDHIHFAGIYPVLGWVLHYVPFFLMGRYWTS
jgi:dolichyl-phosphate-mannose-protein mannosyltransferase